MATHSAASRSLASQQQSAAGKPQSQQLAATTGSASGSNNNNTVAVVAGGGRGGGGGDEPSGPAYCRPIIAHLLPEYTNQHAEAIRQAFLPTSFRTIQSLGAGGAAAEADRVPFRVPRTSNVPFSEFEYSCSPYEAAEDSRAQQRKEDLLKMRRIAGDQEVVAFRTAFPARKDRFDPIWDTPFLHDTFANDEDDASRRREQLLRNVADRPFVPAGVQKSIGKPTRALLTDAMSSLFRCLADDWPDAQPTVLTTAEDLVVVYYPLGQIRNPDGVTTYMNHALRRNEVILEFDLRKVVEGWNVKTDDGFLLFTLRPPWVRSRNFIKGAAGGHADEAAGVVGAAASSSTATGAAAVAGAGMREPQRAIEHR